MQCPLRKSPYVGKAKTSFNIGLNNHREDVKIPDAILPSRNFQEKPRFQQAQKFQRYRSTYQYLQIKRFFTTKTGQKRKLLGSNPVNLAPTRIKPRASYLIKRLKHSYLMYNFTNTTESTSHMKLNFIIRGGSRNFEKEGGGVLIWLNVVYFITIPP